VEQHKIPLANYQNAACECGWRKTCRRCTQFPAKGDICPKVIYALRVKPKTAGDKGYEVIQEHKKAIQNRGAKLINIDEAGVLS